jgi:hypothetical protein
MHRDTVPIDSFQNRYLFYRAFETTEDVFRCLKFCRGFFFVTKSRVADSIFDKLGVFVVCAKLTRDSEQILTMTHQMRQRLSLLPLYASKFPLFYPYNPFKSFIASFTNHYSFFQCYIFHFWVPCYRILFSCNFFLYSTAFESLYTGK